MSGVPGNRGPGPGQRRRARGNGRRRLTALLAGALLLPLFAGCTDEEEHSRSAGGAAQSVADARRAELTSGGRVTWGIDRLPATLNAFQNDADRVTDQVAAAALPMLFTIDAHGRPQLNEDYLRSAEITEREPKQTVVYTLHDKARWNDGESIGAADFVAQWKALNGEDNAYWSARNAGYDRIEKVAPGPEPHQVKVTFAKPYADWRSLFSPLYPRSVTGDGDRFNDGARAELPVSAGPFKVKKVDEDAAAITLVRDDAWWAEPALLDKLVLAAVPRGERRAALLAGKLDVAEVDSADADGITAAAGRPPRAADDGEGQIGNEIEDGGEGEETGNGPASRPATTDALHDLATARLSGEDEVAAAERFARAYAETEQARERAFATREEAVRERLGGFTVHRAYDAAYTHLALNGASPALADERVRWAIARAVDREKLAGLVHEPAGLPTRALGSHLRVLGQAGYQDNSEALGESGTESAAALLDEAGWRPGGQARDDGEGNAAGAAGVPVRAKDGEPLELRFLLPDGAAARQLRAVGRNIVDMLAGIGVSAKITKVPADEYLTDHVAEGDFDLALFSWPATAYPATDARPLFTKPQSIASGEQLIEQNYTRVGTDYIDQLLEQAAGELDEKEHDKLLNRADAHIWAAAGSIPLYQRPQLVAARADLAGVGAFGMETPRHQDIGYRR
ncbi:ABC transporter family substrate-binding protein [Streptomyces litchfieldiae]|uniref:ABC transporter family substrate-binding protein n=1 Tax=Streptomyces litchfieldiae TaxID=3075543 RepID=A0ABU2MLK3_9ACTN|nr:ABC transporter family substrate-binding protein [Streptomyces sp. DSM 44938]MDT0342487.1 ABC transporter family substrate-binding protein [Streptomyces sp. DSM 44938]